MIFISEKHPSMRVSAPGAKELCSETERPDSNEEANVLDIKVGFAHFP